MFSGTAAPLAPLQRLSAHARASRQIVSGKEAAAFGGVAAAVWFSPVLAAHFADADAAYAHLSVVSRFDHVSAAHLLGLISAQHSAQGGWFPLAGVPLAAWLIDPHFGLAHILQYLLIVATFIAFGAIGQRLFRSPAAAIFAVSAVIAAWQLRMPHDPVIGTMLLMPWGALLTLGALWALVCSIDRDSNRFLALACGLMVLAMLSGAVPWAVCAAIAVWAIVARVRGAVWLIGAAAATTAATFTLGGMPQPWKHGGAYALNVLRQLFSALPGSYRASGNLPIGHVPSLYHHGTRYNDDRFINIPSPSRWGWLGVLCVTAGTYFAVLRLRIQSSNAHTLRPWIAGLILWFVPALMLGSRFVWVHGLPLGQSFDGVYFQYFGIGLLAASFVQYLTRRVESMTVLAAITALLVFTASYGNVRADGASLAKSMRADYPRSVIERAGSAGFFERFPEGTTFAVASSMEPPAMPFGKTQTLTYLLYHYTGRRFNVMPLSKLAASDAGRAWILKTPYQAALAVTAEHVASITSSGPLTDRAFAYAPAEDIANLAQVLRQGVRTNVTPLNNGFVIEAARLCGPVPLDQAFAESRPRLAYGPGFYRSGPVGYVKPPQPTNALGDVSSIPNMFVKMFMAPSGTLRLYPSSCPKGFVNLKAVAVAADSSTLTIRQSTGKVTRLHLAAGTGTHFWLRFDMRKYKAPIALQFTTDAPAAPQFDPINFHYEHDAPRDIRIVFEPEGLWEDRGNPSKR